jgi:hypothetical protein
MAADGSIHPSSPAIPLFFLRDREKTEAAQELVDAGHLVEVKEALRGAALPEYRLSYDTRPLRAGGEEYSRLNIEFPNLPEDAGVKALRTVVEKQLKRHQMDQHLTLGAVSLSPV